MRIGRKRMPVDAKVSGSTDIAFGCEDCPARRVVTIANIGGLAMSSEPSPIPFAVTTHTRIEARGYRTLNITCPIVELDQRSCDRSEDTPCPDGDFITSIANKIENHPTNLEWNQDPHVTHLIPPQEL